MGIPALVLAPYVCACACLTKQLGGVVSWLTFVGDRRHPAASEPAVFLLSVQKVAYKSKRWIYDLRTIAEVEGSGVKAWKHAEWKEQILVPALPQSILQGCSLIHIDYYIQVSLFGVSLGWAPSQAEHCGLGAPGIR